MESGPNLQKGCHAAADRNAPSRRGHNPRHDLEQRGLAGTIAADQTDHAAPRNGKRDVLERPVRVPLRFVHAAAEVCYRLTKIRASSSLTQVVPLRYLLYVHGHLIHLHQPRTSTKRACRLWKKTMPLVRAMQAAAALTQMA